MDILVSVLVSYFTTPKPEKELVGFVYSATPKEIRTDAAESIMPWYQRTGALAGLALGMVVILNILF